MKVWGYITAVLLFIGAFFAGRASKRCDITSSEVRRDTITVVDTLIRKIPIPNPVTVVRVDTCYLPRNGRYHPNPGRHTNRTENVHHVRLPCRCRGIPAEFGRNAGLPKTADYNADPPRIQQI